MYVSVTYCYNAGLQSNQIIGPSSVAVSNSLMRYSTDLQCFIFISYKIFGKCLNERSSQEFCLTLTITNSSCGYN